MPIQHEIHDHAVPIKIWASDLDELSTRQLGNVAQLPVIHHHVAAMPDAHVGIGATVGSVLATRDAIIPAAVGVDIGCGMIAARLSLGANQLDEAALKKVFNQISRDVPVGRAQHKDRDARVQAALSLQPGFDRIVEKHPDVMRAFGKSSHWIRQLGSLGGGNHFIEVCLDEAGEVWVMLHSGSRGIGNAIGSYFIALARKDMEQLQANLPDHDLAYFPEGTAHFADYVEAVSWAQQYAAQNRQEMLDIVLAALRRHLPPFEVTTEVVNCHHNYVAREHHFGADVWVTRKGAIRAGKGELGIVPGSMGARSYIVRGLGNPESFESSAHGAGRRMSRAQARKEFTVADMVAQTEGVICRKDLGVVDEIPGAYKDIDVVMANQRDLTEVLHTLKQLICIKG
ncbi:MAG: RtcB family protein [Proteobacteria bacterium]|nr:RtcB family protein [Pseudomonadota bacterium]